jgi:AraC family transcriptional regulator
MVCPGPPVRGFLTGRCVAMVCHRRMQQPFSNYSNAQSEAGSVTPHLTHFADSVLMPRGAINLFERAVEAFESDHERARQCLAQGLALLRGARASGSRIRPIGGPSTAQVGLARWQLRRVAAHIDENLAGPIQVRDLAALSRLSSSYFSRAFKKTTGVTPYAFIIQKRFARACELMTTTGESLCQIAVACGLSDQSHLCRVFRCMVGEAPSTWRRANATGPTTPRHA